MPAEFKANLNPTSNKTDIIDLMKMEDYLGRKPSSVAKSNNMVKSSANDKGVEFKFNSNQDATDTTG